jgi:hypothetical protein
VSSDFLLQPLLKTSNKSSVEIASQSTSHQVPVTTESQLQQSTRKIAQTERADAASFVLTPEPSSMKEVLAWKTAIVKLKIPSVKMERALAGSAEHLPMSAGQEYQLTDASPSQIVPIPAASLQRSSNVGSENDINQCAQRALSPKLTSSQGLTSSDNSVYANSHQPQLAISLLLQID